MVVLERQSDELLAIAPFRPFTQADGDLASRDLAWFFSSWCRPVSISLQFKLSKLALFRDQWPLAA